MKIYKKVVIDISSGYVVEEISYEYKGELDLCGGGGPSGLVDFPTYMKIFHEDWLGDPGVVTNISSVMASLINNPSPYVGESAYDPDIDLDASQARHDSYDTLVTALAHSADWQAMVDSAVTKASNATVYPKTNLIDNDMATDAISDIITAATSAAGQSQFTALTTAFEVRAVKRQQRSIAKFTAGMADANAVMNSAFMIGLAITEADVRDEVNEFDAKIDYDVVSSLVKIGVDKVFSAGVMHLDARYRMTLEGIAQMANLQTHNISASKDATTLQAELSRIKIVAKGEEHERNIELDVADALWDISVFQHGANFLASINGAPMVPKGISRQQSAIGGALSGAGVGLAAGSTFGPVGAGVGAGVGALVGAIGGWNS